MPCLVGLNTHLGSMCILNHIYKLCTRVESICDTEHCLDSFGLDFDFQLSPIKYYQDLISITGNDIIITDLSVSCLIKLLMINKHWCLTAGLIGVFICTVGLATAI